MSFYYVAGIPYSDELYHFGIKGQRWGQRRFQNEDGSLTADGYRRYGVQPGGMQQGANAQYGTHSQSVTTPRAVDEQARANRRSKIKTGLKVGAALVGAGLAAYGGYKLSQIKNGSSKNNDLTRRVFGPDFSNARDPFSFAYTVKKNKPTTTIRDKAKKVSNIVGEKYRSGVTAGGKLAVKANEHMRNRALERHAQNSGLNVIKNIKERKAINNKYNESREAILNRTSEFKKSPLALYKYGKEKLPATTSHISKMPIAAIAAYGVNKATKKILGKSANVTIGSIAKQRKNKRS